MSKFDENKAKSAGELFSQGYNCSQSVIAAWADEIGLDRQTALLVSSGFGGGMGRLSACGRKVLICSQSRLIYKVRRCGSRQA